MNEDPLALARNHPAALHVPHGTWLPASFEREAGLMLWAEVPILSRATAHRTVPLHPFHLSPDGLRSRWPEIQRAPDVEQTLTLPSRGGVPQASHRLLEEACGQPVHLPLSFASWKVSGLMLGSREAASWLLSLPQQEDLRSERLLPADDLLFWQAAARLALRILMEEHFLPGIVGQGGENGTRSAWQPLWDAPGIAEPMQRLIRAMPAVCLSFSLDPKSGKTGLSAEDLLHGFLCSVVDAQIRCAWGERGPSLPAPRTPHDAWLTGLLKDSPAFPISMETAAALGDSLNQWKGRLQAACANGIRACLRLRSPSVDSKRWRLEYLLQAASDLSFLVGAEEIWAGSPASGKLATLSGENPEEQMLAALALAGRVFPPIEKSLRGSQPGGVALDTDQAYLFLKEAAPVLSGSGFGIFLPPWWRTSNAPRLGVQLSLRPKQTSEGAFGIDSWLSLNWSIALGDQTLTSQELEELARMKVPLVRIRGEWVEVEPDALKKAVDFWMRHEKSGLTLGDLARAIREEGAGRLGVSDLRGEGWIGEFLNGGSGAASFKTLPPPRDFQGRLRPYQERGFSWLAFLRSCGFGACLADDMGLGKTIQALAFLLREKREGRLQEPALLLCPTSLVGNWRKEAERFSPSLKVLIHHGAGRRKAARSFLRQARSHDLVVSTYALSRQDQRALSLQGWSGILLDEAQNIKNPDTLQSRCVRSLKGRFRIALTGTPMENRLTELWSVMEFLNPGYLGPLEDFERRFAFPIERLGDARASATLRRMVQPFILRRLKTDPKIISDLPEKLEMKVFCTITQEQATLYRAVVAEMMEKIESAEGLKRRGLVLAALTRLKQVLNHPAQFLKDGSKLADRSGKLERLTEMLDEVLRAGDSALVFTQYAEMGELLKRHLQACLLREALFFHGGLLKSAREDLVERFLSGQAPVLILTLKAGGLGLNLVRANHVFHYDRWWNPAVENQATDRAFRIGQTKKVQVHKFICLGTLEDKIDEMIESKKALGEKILGAGESHLTELSNTQLREIFALREAVLADGS